MLKNITIIAILVTMSIIITGCGLKVQSPIVKETAAEKTASAVEKAAKLQEAADAAKKEAAEVAAAALKEMAAKPATAK